MMQPTVLHAIRTGAAGLLLASHALATTWVVDDNGGPGVDFVNVQDAIDAAADGDVIEVRDGTYPAFTIDGKSLVVISTADAGAGERVRVNAPVSVVGLAASQAVELDGLWIPGELTFPLPGMHVAPPGTPCVALSGNDGSVRLVDSYMRNRWPTCGGDGSPICGESALVVAQSDQVVLLRCTLIGSNALASYECPGDYSACVAWDGIRATGSNLHVLSSVLDGGYGSCNDRFDYVECGGAGASLDGASTMLVSDSVIRGFADPCLTGFCSSARRSLVVESGSSATAKDTDFVGATEGDVTEVAIAPYCLGTFEECPCGNNGAGTAGCEHSFGTGGARLEGVGNASVAADTVTLQVTGLNPSASPTALFFQGTTGSEGIPFNDGLLCAGGTIRRMKGKLAQNGAVSFGFGQPGDPLVSVAGNVPPAGATRYYQVWYRNNSASFCTPQRFNMSNGVEIAWAP